MSVQSELEEKRKLLEQFMVGAREKEHAGQRELGFWVFLEL